MSYFFESTLEIVVNSRRQIRKNIHIQPKNKANWRGRMTKPFREQFLRRKHRASPANPWKNELGVELQPDTKKVGLGRRNQNKLLLILLGSLTLLASSSLIWFRNRIFAPSEHIVLSMRGSTSLGDQLMPKLAEAFLRDEMGAEQTGFKVARRDAQGHSFLHVWGKVPDRHELQVIEIYASGSSAAFECLAAETGRNSCDIGMASRPINDVDKETFPVLRKLRNHATEHVVALDAIAIIINPRNPVSQLSISQLRAIYTGQIRNWKNVGGNDAPIELYGRNRDSATFETFTE